MALKVAENLGVNFDKFSVGEFTTGMNTELEHGTTNMSTNVTNDDLEKTAKIALVHLYEHPNYYNPNYGLKVFERFLTEKEKRANSY